MATIIDDPFASRGLSDRGNDNTNNTGSMRDSHPTDNTAAAGSESDESGSHGGSENGAQTFFSATPSRGQNSSRLAESPWPKLRQDITLIDNKVATRANLDLLDLHQNIAETIPQPAALAETVLGQQIQVVARQMRNELLGPLNGIDYHHHRPPADLHADDLSSRLWALHTQRDANEVISHIIRTNIEVLRRVGAQLDKRYQDLKKRAFALIHLSTQPSTDRGFLRGEVARTRTAMKEHECWVAVLASEVRLSQVALQRMDMACEAISMRDRFARGELGPWEMYYLQQTPLAAYHALRAEVAKVAAKVYLMTGNADFIERHKNELWDVVAWQVEVK